MVTSSSNQQGQMLASLAGVSSSCHVRHAEIPRIALGSLTDDHQEHLPLTRSQDTPRVDPGPTMQCAVGTVPFYQHCGPPPAALSQTMSER